MQIDSFQKLFYNAVFAEDEESKKQLNPHLKGIENLTANESLKIYRNSIIGQLNKTLSAIYPVCLRLLGEEFFNFTAFNYIKIYPSLSPDLGDYGANFANFLANFEPVKELVYLADVAKLEWCYDRVFQGKDNPKFNIQALNKISPENWEQLIFLLPQNSFLIESKYPIHRIWEINQSDDQEDEIIDLNQGGIKIFLWRQDYNIRLDFPNNEEWQLLNYFQQKLSLETITPDESNINLDRLLPLFFQRGWITNFSIYEQKSKGSGLTIKNE